VDWTVKVGWTSPYSERLLLTNRSKRPVSRPARRIRTNSQTALSRTTRVQSERQRPPLASGQPMSLLSDSPFILAPTTPSRTAILQHRVLTNIVAVSFRLIPALLYTKMPTMLSTSATISTSMGLVVPPLIVSHPRARRLLLLMTTDADTINTEPIST
jgi:hypothetical protein